MKKLPIFAIIFLILAGMMISSHAQTIFSNQKPTFPPIKTVPAIPTPTNEPKSLYAERVDSGRRLLTQGLAPEAEAMFFAALRAEPSNPGNALVMANLSEAQRLSGKYNEAIESCDIGLVRYPASSILRMNRAKALLESGREPEAVDEIETILRADSANIPALRMRLILAARSSQSGNEAKQNGIRGISLRLLKADPKADDAFYFLAEADRGEAMFAAAHATKDSLYSAAFANYRQALELNPLEEYFIGYIQAMQEADTSLSAAPSKAASGAANLPPADYHADIIDALASAMRLYPEDWRFFVLRAAEHKRRFENEAAELDLRSAVSKGADPVILK